MRAMNNTINCGMAKLVTIVFIALSFVATAQPMKKVSADPEEAAEHYKHYNYVMAMPIYKALVQKEPKNVDYNYRLGICYLRTFFDKKESIKYFETASKDPKCPIDTWYFLGHAYHLALKFDEAISAFEKYKELVPKNKAELDKTDHQIMMVNNAKELVKFPVNVTFTNLGPEVNSEYPDYFPFVTADEQTLFYTSRRKGGHATQVESDGYYSSDIFFCQVAEGGHWDKCKNLGSQVNTTLDEEIVGLRPDGTELVVYIDHIDADKVENLYVTHKKNNVYTKIEKFSESVNNAKEYAGTILETEEGPVLFFSRKDDKSYGETDLYMARKIPNGNWGLPQNLGPNINSKYKEDFPYLTPDGKTLYFSSEGHSSIGGFDLFKSVWDEEAQTWGKPQNLGYPLNTPDDEQQIYVFADHRAAYVSAWRPGGLGNLDIYRVKFEDDEQKITVFRGKVDDLDSTNASITEATITLVDKKSNEEKYFKVNPSTGTYIMALPPGKYAVTVTCDGYKEHKEDLIIFDFGYKGEVNKDYILKK